MSTVSKIRLTPIFAGILGFFVAICPAQGQTVGDAARGDALANSWCTSCHIIDERGTGTAIDPAPSFPQIAKDAAKTRAYLLHWLSTSHPQMPNFNLGRREMEDLIAYIQSQG